MAMDLARPDLVAAVFGTGSMGRGIAQLCAQAGLSTLLFDSREGAVEEAIVAIGNDTERLVARGRMDAAARKQLLAKRSPVLPQILRQLLDAHPVDPGATPVPLHPLQRGLQVVAVQDRFHQAARSRALYLASRLWGFVASPMTRTCWP